MKQLLSLAVFLLIPFTMAFGAGETDVATYEIEGLVDLGPNPATPAPQLVVEYLDPFAEGLIQKRLTVDSQKKFDLFLRGPSGPNVIGTTIVFRVLDANGNGIVPGPKVSVYVARNQKVKYTYPFAYNDDNRIARRHLIAKVGDKIISGGNETHDGTYGGLKVIHCFGFFCYGSLITDSNSRYPSKFFFWDISSAQNSAKAFSEENTRSIEGIPLVEQKLSFDDCDIDLEFWALLRLKALSPTRSLTTATCVSKRNGKSTPVVIRLLRKGTTYTVDKLIYATRIFGEEASIKIVEVIDSSTVVLRRDFNYTYKSAVVNLDLDTVKPANPDVNAAGFVKLSDSLYVPDVGGVMAGVENNQPSKKATNWSGETGESRVGILSAKGNRMMGWFKERGELQKLGMWGVSGAAGTRLTFPYEVAGRASSGYFTSRDGQLQGGIFDGENSDYTPFDEMTKIPLVTGFWRDGDPFFNPLSLFYLGVSFPNGVTRTRGACQIVHSEMVGGPAGPRNLMLVVNCPQYVAGPGFPCGVGSVNSALNCGEFHWEWGFSMVAMIPPSVLGTLTTTTVQATSAPAPTPTIVTVPTISPATVTLLKRRLP